MKSKHIQRKRILSVLAAGAMCLSGILLPAHGLAQTALNSISVAPANRTIGIGQTQQFQATEMFGDGSQQIVTKGPALGVALHAGANRLVIVDPPTGTVTPVGDAIGTMGVSAGVSAFDAGNNRYFVSAAGRLFTIDTSAGTVSDVRFPSASTVSFLPGISGVSSMEYDPIQDRMFGIALDSSTGVNFLVEVDPTTGDIGLIGGGLGTTGVSAGVSALDPANNEYFVSAAGRLLTIDTATGTVSPDPAPVFPGVSSLHYDSNTSTLLAVALVSGMNKLVKVDPATGAFTEEVSGQLPGPMGVSGGVSALDAATNRYVASFGGRLLAINTQTGATSPIPAPPFSGVSSLETGPFWSSSNETVATIDQTGLLTAQGPGMTTIRAASATISCETTGTCATLTVLAQVIGDLDGDLDVDRDDLRVLLADRNNPVGGSACGAPCDLNQDGLITALDARILVTLCTRPRCAVEP